MDTRPKLFNNGDEVRLKSGGPVMRVSAAPDHVAYCTWTVDGTRHDGTFDQSDLEPAESE